jgi:hypothetical protein
VGRRASARAAAEQWKYPPRDKPIRNVFVFLSFPIQTKPAK